MKKGYHIRLYHDFLGSHNDVIHWNYLKMIPMFASLFYENAIEAQPVGGPRPARGLLVLLF
jgi:hypothetical protein